MNKDLIEENEKSNIRHIAKILEYLESIEDRLILMQETFQYKIDEQTIQTIINYHKKTHYKLTQLKQKLINKYGM